MSSSMTSLCVVLSLVTMYHVTIAALHGADSTVCTDGGINVPAGITNMARPNITNQFRARIEIAFVKKNQTETVTEYFDSVNNRGFIEQTVESLRYDALYSYKTNEFIGFYPDATPGAAGSCQVQDLSNSDQRFLFGYEKVNGKSHIFSAAGALHFAGQGQKEHYMGNTTVRGILVDQFRSCQYWSGLDATMTVDWYFTSRGTWDSATSVRVPVMAHIVGRAYDVKTGVPHDFEHYYNIYDFYPYVGADLNSKFETPAGFVCPGRKLTKPFPTVPSDAFSFTTEILNLQTNQIAFMKETFFHKQKVVKYEYRPMPGTYAPYGYSDLIEIHDFHSGVAYITDAARGNCSYRAIEGSDFDDKSAGPNTVRIRNSQEFFYFDVKTPSYEGVKKNRNIDCDSWVATRGDYPPNNPSNSSWEWYFATNQWTELMAGPEAGGIPVQMRINIPNLGWQYEYNLYNFKKSLPDLLKFDISGCFTFRPRRKFQFMLPVTGTTKATISTNTEPFKYYILQAIMQATQISPLRVAHLQVFFADNVIVTFELLDSSPIVGDTQKAPNYKEVSLDFAANMITQQIQSGQFLITLGGDAFINIQPLKAMPNSVVEITYKNSTTTIQNQQQTGYGPGPMAAVGISMPILGGALGVVFAYFFFK